MITLDEFSRLDYNARRSYLARHPEDIRFDLSTLDDELPGFTQEYTERLQKMWPTWDEDHAHDPDHIREDISLTDRLYQAGFTEFYYDGSVNGAYWPRPYAAQLYDDIPSKVRMLIARIPGTEKTARYLYVRTGNQNKWIKSTKLARETRDAEEIKKYIADQLKGLVVIGPYPDTIDKDMQELAPEIARAFGPKKIRDIYGTFNGFIKELSSSRDICDLLKAASYEKRKELLLAAARLYGIAQDGHAVCEFIEKIHDRISHILSSVDMFEITGAGKDRQEKEMSWCMRDSFDVRAMIGYPSSENVNYAAMLFAKVVDIEAHIPGRSLTSMIDPVFPTTGYMGYPKNFYEAVVQAHKEGRDEEIRTVYKKRVEEVLHPDKADALSGQIADLLFEKAISEIENPGAACFYLARVDETIRAAARGALTKEEIEQTIDICLKNPRPGFYGFATKTLAEYICEQTNEKARKIITSEDPEKEAGIMRTRTYMEKKVSRIKNKEAAITEAESRGEDVTSEKEKLLRMKTNLATYVDDRLKNIKEEDIDEFLTPSEQALVADICKENSQDWVFNACGSDLEEVVIAKRMHDSCVYINEDVVVYVAEGAAADSIWCLSPNRDEHARASITLDTATGHVYAAYRDIQDVPDGMETELAVNDSSCYEYRVDMTEALGGPATAKTAAEKVTKCARMLMEKFDPPITFDRAAELTKACNDINSETRDFIGKERSSEQNIG